MTFLRFSSVPCKRLAHASCLTLTAWLATGAVAQAETTARYRSWGIEVTAAASANGSVNLRLLDASLAAPLVANINVKPAPNLQAFAMPLAFQSVSATQGRYLGQAMLVYVNEGRVRKLSSLAGASTAPEQVSSLTDACGISTDFNSVNLAGTDAAYLVHRKGTAASCAEANGALVFVRTSMSATTAPLAPPAGARVVDVLQATPNSLDALLVWEPGSRLALYRPDMTRIGTVKGGEAQPAVPIPMTHLGTAVGFYEADGKVHRLNWSKTGGTWSTPLFTGSVESYNADANLMAFSSGQQLLVLEASSTAARRLATLPYSVRNIAVGPTRVAVALNDTAGMNPLYGVARAGGTPTRLDAGTAPAWMMGQDGDTLYFATGNYLQMSLYSVSMAGKSAATALLHGINLPSSVVDPLVSMGRQVRMVGVVYCQPQVAGAACAKGSLMQYDLATKAKTVLGTVSLGKPALIYSEGLVAGLPFVLTASAFATASDASGVADVLLAKPGVAGSLKRLTTNLK